MFREEQLEVTTVNWRNKTQFQSDLTHLFRCFNPLFTRRVHNKSLVDISFILKCCFLKKIKKWTQRRWSSHAGRSGCVDVDCIWLLPAQCGSSGLDLPLHSCWELSQYSCQGNAGPPCAWTLLTPYLQPSLQNCLRHEDRNRNHESV